MLAHALIYGEILGLPIIADTYRAARASGCRRCASVR
jgi:hypothetical protein